MYTGKNLNKGQNKLNSEFHYPFHLCFLVDITVIIYGTLSVKLQKNRENNFVKKGKNIMPYKTAAASKLY